MAVLAENGRVKLWFGTVDRMGWTPTPNRGASINPEGWSAGGGLLSGGAYQLGSFTSAQTYTFEWPESSSQEVAQIMKSYYDGSYGRGLIYFLDPLCYTTNLLPPMWADPSMAIASDAETLIPGVLPGSTPTTSSETNDLPVRSAVYSVTGGATAGTPTFTPVVKNYLPNSRLVASSTWAEIRRQAWQRPRMSVTGASGLSLGAGLSAVTDTAGLRLTGNATANLYAIIPALAERPVPVAGDTWSWSFRVRNNSSSAVTLRAQMLWGGPGASSMGADVVVSAGDTSTLFVEGVAPAGSTWLGAIVRCVSNAPALDITVLDGPQLEKGPYRGWTPWNGDEKPEDLIHPEDFRVRWLGTANASESVVEGNLVRDFVAGNGVVSIVSNWQGKPAIRLINVSGTSNSTYTGVALPAALLGGGVFIATKHQETVITAGSGGYNLMVANPPETSTYTNQVGSVKNRLVFGAKDAGARAYLGSRAVAGGGDVWFTDVGLFPSDYTGDYFNGSTGTVEVNGQTLTTRWDGVVDNSTSSAGILTFSTPPLLDDANSVFIPIPDGYTLHIGAYYSSSSPNGGVYVSRVSRGGNISQQVERLTPMETTDTALFTHMIQKQPGEIGVRLWVGKVTAPVVTLVLAGMHARLAPTGKPVRGVQNWVGGQGHSGVRFAGPPTKTNVSGVNGGQVGYAATFREVGSWVMG